MNLFEDLTWRGLIHDATDRTELQKLLDGGSMTYYVGFDPTAASLHVGHLTQVLTARRLQLAGHRPLLLVGGATGMIGDPREVGERIMNSAETVAGWVAAIRAQVAPFVTYHSDPAGDTDRRPGDNAAVLVNNLDWTGETSAIDFLREVGKHFPVNRMLAREVVKARLETGISFTEFAYQLLQANDFFELHRRYNCQLQFGGSDQWGNITAGVDFIRRKGLGPVQAFSTPLVTRADGKKIGKTDGGSTVWLDPEMTSPYAFYQFWINADDKDVLRYLRFFSFRGHEEILALDAATVERPGAREAQRALAGELTTLVHGQAETDQVIAASQALFGRGELDGLAAGTLRAALAEAGLVTLPAALPVAALLKESGLVSSMNEARRAIAEGGAYVNNVRATDPEEIPAASALLHGRFLVLRRGRKTLAGVEIGGIRSDLRE